MPEKIVKTSVWNKIICIYSLAICCKNVILEELQDGHPEHVLWGGWCNTLTVGISLTPLQMKGTTAAEHCTSFHCCRKGGRTGRHHGLHDLQHPKQNENSGSVAQKRIKNFKTATADHLMSALPFQVTTEVTHP